MTCYQDEEVHRVTVAAAEVNTSIIASIRE